MASRKVFPVVSTDIPDNLHLHLHQLYTDLNSTLDAIISQNRKPPADSCYRLKDSFASLRQKILDQGTNTEQNDRLKLIQQELREHIEKSRLIDEALLTNTANTARATATASRPAQLDPKAVIDLTNVKDPKKVIIKLEPGVGKQFRNLQPAQINDRINSGLRASNSEVLQEIVIAASRQLKSGDLEVHANNADEANALVLYSGDWVQCLGSGSYVQQHTYGIVVNTIRTKLLGGIDTPEQQLHAKQRIVAENHLRLQSIKEAEDIKAVEWLSRHKKDKAMTSICLEFASARQANECIREKILLDGELHVCIIRDRNRRVKRCYNCQLFGHISSACTGHTRCGRCADKGHSRDKCPKPPGIKRCVPCKGPHVSGDEKACPIMAYHTAKVEELKALDANPNIRRFWPESPEETTTITDQVRTPILIEAAPATHRTQKGQDQTQDKPDTGPEQRPGPGPGPGPTAGQRTDLHQAVEEQEGTTGTAPDPEKPDTLSVDVTRQPDWELQQAGSKQTAEQPITRVEQILLNLVAGNTQVMQQLTTKLSTMPPPPPPVKKPAVRRVTQIRGPGGLVHQPPKNSSSEDSSSAGTQQRAAGKRTIRRTARAMENDTFDLPPSKKRRTGPTGEMSGIEEEISLSIETPGSPSTPSTPGPSPPPPSSSFPFTTQEEIVATAPPTSPIRSSPPLAQYNCSTEEEDANNNWRANPNFPTLSTPVNNTVRLGKELEDTPTSSSEQSATTTMGNQHLLGLTFNVNHQKDGVTSPLLNNASTTRYDWIAVQDPPWSKKNAPDTTHNSCPQVWHTVFPTQQEVKNEHPRVCFFVHKRIPLSDWTIRWHSADLATLTLTYRYKNETTQEVEAISTVDIHNIYQEPGRSTTDSVAKLANLLDGPPPTASDYHDHLVVGDFNTHHPSWGGPLVEADDRAEDILQLMDNHCLQLLLPLGTTTYISHSNEARSTLDLVMATPELADRLIYCKPRNSLRQASDHSPVEITFNIQMEETRAKIRKQWELTDHEVLRQVLKDTLPQSQAQNPPVTEDEIDGWATQITQSLIQAIDAAVPTKQTTKYSVPGWTEELSQVIKEAKRTKRRYDQTQTEEDRAANIRQQNKKKKMIRNHNRWKFRDHVQEAGNDPKKLWKLAKWAKGRKTPYRAYTPPLAKQQVPGQYATTPEEKASILWDKFFPAPPTIDKEGIPDLSNPPQPPYPTAYYEQNNLKTAAITITEIRQAIERVPAHKAPGPCGTPNLILQKHIETLGPSLVTLFNASVQQGYYPKVFRESITVSLKKPGKDDYSSPKSYRPIALLSTIGKVLESVMANRIAWVEYHKKSLPLNHLGARKGISCDLAAHMLIERIYAAWRTGKVASVLFMDVAGAFDNVNKDRLVHNLRRRHLDGPIADWIDSFLSDRKTSLKLPEHTTDMTSVQTGIPQGSPLSPILWLYYNADLLEQCTIPEEGIHAFGWVDDTALLAEGSSYQENSDKLARIHNDRAESWRKQHGAKFEPSKYILMHFRPPFRAQGQRYRAPKSGEAPVVLEGVTIQHSEKARYLGIIFDPRLYFTAHVNEIQRKAQAGLAMLSSLRQSTWGISLIELRNIYNGTLVPQFLFGVTAWYNPDTEGGSVRAAKAVAALKKIQARAAKIITGTWRTSPTDALDAEAYILPVELKLKESRDLHLVRMRSCPQYKLIQQIREQALEEGRELNPDLRTAYPSPLMLLEKRFRVVHEVDLDRIETRLPFIRPPHHEAPTIHIALSKEEAEQEHAICTLVHDAHVLYTDGSGINDRIGSAAYSSTTGKSSQAYLGEENEYNVYAGELYGILMAIKIAREDEGTDRDKPVHIYTDNQAAISSVYNPKNQSGQYIIRQIVYEMYDLKRHDGTKRPVTINWIPAHIGVEGNETADKLAKMATGWRENNTFGPPPTKPPAGLRPLISAYARIVKERTKTQWQTYWKDAQHGSHLRGQHLPEITKDTLDKYRNMEAWTTSIVAQLRIGKLGLRDHLHQIKAADSPDCQLCNAPRQTIHHALFVCQGLETLRNEVLWEEGKPQHSNLNDLLSDRTSATRAAQFLIQSRLLHQFRWLGERIYPRTEATQAVDDMEEVDLA